MQSFFIYILMLKAIQFLGLIHFLSQDKDMGCGSQIRVASLNFSGINTNPFEYHDGTDFFDKLNDKYKKIRNAEFPKIEKWVGANLDKHYKEQRFTVLQSGLLLEHLKDKLFSKQQFYDHWNSIYKKNQSDVIEEMEPDPTQLEVEDVIKMDYSFYRAVVMAVYQHQTIEEYESKCVTEDANKLKEFLVNFKNRPPFQLDVKKKLVEDFYQKIDVMFLQEASSVKWQSFQGFSYVKQHDSLIIYKTETFGQKDEAETTKWVERLNINKDTSIVIKKKRFLLISSHFTSKDPGFRQNEATLCKQLNKVLQQYKGDKKFNVIVGMDANHFVKDPKITGQIFIAPLDESTPTTIKKRSYIQAQLQKADKAVHQVKDHIISTLPIKTHEVLLIDGQKGGTQLLPSNQHPYDHFIVSAVLNG